MSHEVRERVRKEKEEQVPNSSIHAAHLHNLSMTSEPDKEEKLGPQAQLEAFTEAQPRYSKVRLSQVLGTTWVAYAAYIISRKPFTIVRIDVQQEIGMSTFASGMVDTSYHAMYCVGQVFYSSIKSKYSSKTIISAGLFGAAMCTLCFSLTSNSMVMVLLWGLCGLFGSLGWPSCVSVVTPWLAAKERGKIMGVWGSCQAVGSLLANWLVASLLMYGWRFSYLGVVVIVGLIGILVITFLIEHPNRAGMVSPVQWGNGMRPADVEKVGGNDITVDGEVVWSKNITVTSDVEVETKKEQVLTAWELARLPSVLDIALVYFCQKLVRYSIMSWLPYYLTKELGYSTMLAGYVASSFDFGGIVGSVASGVFADWYAGGKRRVGACQIYIQCGTVSLLLFSVLKPLMQSSMVLTCTLSCLIGFFIFGCDTLMTGATMQDLAERLKIPNQAGSLSGFVGGIGSTGAILQGPITAMLAENYGWSSVFYFLIALSAAAVLAMVRPMLVERRHETLHLDK